MYMCTCVSTVFAGEHIYITIYTCRVFFIYIQNHDSKKQGLMNISEEKFQRERPPLPSSCTYKSTSPNIIIDYVCCIIMFTPDYRYFSSGFFFFFVKMGIKFKLLFPVSKIYSLISVFSVYIRLNFLQTLVMKVN